MKSWAFAWGISWIAAVAHAAEFEALGTHSAAAVVPADIQASEEYTIDDEGGEGARRH